METFPLFIFTVVTENQGLQFSITNIQKFWTPGQGFLLDVLVCLGSKLFNDFNESLGFLLCVIYKFSLVVK